MSCVSIFQSRKCLSSKTTCGTRGKMSVFKFVICICVLDTRERVASTPVPNSNDPANTCLTICAKTSAWWSLISRIAVPWVAVIRTMAVGRPPLTRGHSVPGGPRADLGKEPAVCLSSHIVSVPKVSMHFCLTLLLLFGVMSAKALLPSFYPPFRGPR